MSSLKEVLDKPWDFTVYIYNNNQYVIELAFFEQIIDYTIFYYLTEEDIKHIDDIEYFLNLSNKIRQNRPLFNDRTVNDQNIYNI